MVSPYYPGFISPDDTYTTKLRPTSIHSLHREWPTSVHLHAACLPFPRRRCSFVQGLSCCLALDAYALPFLISTLPCRFNFCFSVNSSPACQKYPPDSTNNKHKYSRIPCKPVHPHSLLILLHSKPPLIKVLFRPPQMIFLTLKAKGTIS